jgi:hypothetical protein
MQVKTSALRERLLIWPIARVCVPKIRGFWNTFSYNILIKTPIFKNSVHLRFLNALCFMDCLYFRHQYGRLVFKPLKLGSWPASSSFWGRFWEIPTTLECASNFLIIMNYSSVSSRLVRSSQDERKHVANSTLIRTITLLVYCSLFSCWADVYFSAKLSRSGACRLRVAFIWRKNVALLSSRRQPWILRRQKPEPL